MTLSATRPVPLMFDYRVLPLHEVLEELLGTHQAPVYVVFPTQAAAIERAGDDRLKALLRTLA